MDGLSLEEPGKGQSDPVVVVRLLGQFEVTLDDLIVPVRAPQERALLALLSTAPGQIRSKADIVAGMWGDDPPPRADKTIEVYVSRLRRAIGHNGAGFVATRAPGYVFAIDPQCVDAAQFVALADAGRRALAASRTAEAADLLHQATALWTGDALAEFRAPFAERERTRLNELRLTATEASIAADLALGGGPELVGQLGELVVANPMRERLWEHLITALYRAGRQAEALAAFHQIRTKMIDDLGIEPGQRLRDLERMVLVQDPALLTPHPVASSRPPVTTLEPVSSSQADAGAVVGPAEWGTGPCTAPWTKRSTPLVGRASELNALRDSLTSAPGVRAVVVLGEAGVGKTRLVSEAASVVAKLGAIVTLGQCLPLSEALPFSPIIQALRAWTRFGREPMSAVLQRTTPYVRAEASRLLPELDQSDRAVHPAEGWGRERLFSALAELLGAMAGQAILVVVVEDLHWADQTTLDFLAYLIATGAPGDVRVVCTCRKEDADDNEALVMWISQVTRYDSVVQLSLGPFTLAETAEHIRALTSMDTSADVVDKIYRRGGGNAFLTEQIAVADTIGPGLGSGDVSMSAQLAYTLRSRLSKVSVDARDVVVTLAVAARSMGERQLAAVVGREVDRVRHQLQWLVRAWLVDADTEGRYRLRHAVLGEVINAGLLAGERVEQHRAIAEVLSTEPTAAAAEVAAHFSAAGCAEQELIWTLAAAQDADRLYAWSEAARHWTRVVRLRDEVAESARPPELHNLFSIYSRARDAANRAGDSLAAQALAEEALRRLSDTADLAVRARLWHNVANYRGIASPEAGIVAIQTAIALYDRLPPSPAHADALINYLRMRGHAGICRDMDSLEAALKIARAANAPAQEAALLSELAVEAQARGDLDEALDLLARATRALDGSSDPTALAGVATNHICVLADAGQLDQAVTVGRAALARLETFGLLHYFNTMGVLGNMCDVLVAQGRVAEAVELIFPVATGSPSRSTWPAHNKRAILEIMQGELSTADERLDAIDPAWLASSLAFFQGGCSHSHVELRLWQHRPEEALTDAPALLEKIADTDLLPVSGQFACMVMRAFADNAMQARDRRQVGRSEQTELAADRLAALVEASPGPPFHGHVTAVAECLTWKAERSRVHGVVAPPIWTAAAKEWERHGRPFDAAYALWRLAEGSLVGEEPTDTGAWALRRAVRRSTGHRPLRDAVLALADRHQIDLDMADTESPYLGAG